jgi:hypothetical protein
VQCMKARPVLSAVALLVTCKSAYGADGSAPGESGRESANGSAPGAFLGPLPTARRSGADADERRYPLTPRPEGGAFYDSLQFAAVIAPDGTVTFRDHRLRYSRRETLFSFDLSDEFAREFAHNTLYPREKANFLADTFRKRTDMAAQVYAAQMRAALRDIPARLDALWADTRYRRRERRRVIFLLWEEADRSEYAGHSADQIIGTWIRRHLPFGSPDAYSKSELESLSHEWMGKPPFNPYGASLEMRAPTQP